MGFGSYLDVQEFLCEYRWAMVDWLTRSIEGPSHHFDTDGHLQNVTSELAMSVQIVDA